MKIIDLLNKIANGEVKDREKFRVIFKNNLTRDIYYYKPEGCSIRSLRNCSDDYDFQDDYDLDDKVEILEDEEPEIDIQGIEELELSTLINSHYPDHIREKEIRTRLNTILQAIKQQERRINKQEKRINKLESNQ